MSKYNRLNCFIYNKEPQEVWDLMALLWQHAKYTLQQYSVKLHAVNCIASNIQDFSYLRNVLGHSIY